MENFRIVRWQYPPIALVGSLVVGILADRCRGYAWLINKLPNDDAVKLIGLILSSGILLVSSGYIIGTITKLTMNMISFLFKNGIHYEFSKSMKLENEEARLFCKFEEGEKFFAVINFDHAKIPKEIHEWIQRRYHSFHTSANLSIALTLAFLVGRLAGINHSNFWTLGTLVLVILYIIDAFRSRSETIQMINFQLKYHR